MANHLSDILAIWEPQKEQAGWVLATIVETEGSSYRKPGAMMLINDLGQYFGLLSGGCLEADIMRHARQCMERSSNKVIEYDMREETDLAWQLGLGCGGRVRILLQPVTLENEYHFLDKLLFILKSGKPAYYLQEVEASKSQNILSEAPFGAQLLNEYSNIFVSSHSPQIALAVFGGGVDARPVVNMANTMGWQVYLIDHRTGYAREKYFPGCVEIIRQPTGELAAKDWLQKINAAIVMTHNIDHDAAALKLIEKSSAEYVGLLGPSHRTESVFATAQIAKTEYLKTLWNPMGLAIGGELPETIALSVLSEIHAVLHKEEGESLGMPLSHYHA